MRTPNRSQATTSPVPPIAAELGHKALHGHGGAIGLKKNMDPVAALRLVMKSQAEIRVRSHWNPLIPVRVLNHNVVPDLVTLLPALYRHVPRRRVWLEAIWWGLSGQGVRLR